MTARFAIFAAAAIIAGGAVAAEPPKAPTPESAQPHAQAQELALASADEARTPAPSADQPNAAPVKRPHFARVTTCRCGDPQAQPEQ